MEKTDVTNKANNCKNNVAAILFVLLIFWELDSLTKMLYPAYDEVTSKITNKLFNIPSTHVFSAIYIKRRTGSEVGC